MPQSNIENRLNLFFREIQKYEWCNFPIEGFPYHIAKFRLQYLLKYFYSYSLFWYSIFNECNMPDKVNILSLGCGVGLDFEALEWVRNKKFSDSTIDYKGFDIQNWDFRVVHPEATFFTESITSIDPKLLSSTEVFTFPHSISDIGEDNLSKFGALLDKTELKDDLHFIFTLRNTHDLIEFQPVHDALIAKGYVASRWKNNFGYKNITLLIGSHWYPFEEQGRISDKIEIYYPDEIIAKMTNIYDGCGSVKKDSSFDCILCENGKSFDFPMLKTCYWIYCILRYEKNDTECK